MNAATRNGEHHECLLLYNYGLVGLGEPIIRSNNYGLMGFGVPEPPSILVKSVNFGLMGSSCFEGGAHNY